MEEARLQKLLASADIGSRRSCEALITGGKVKVNGAVVTELGAKANPDTDVIAVGVKRVSFAVEKVYLVLNKPLGYVTTVSDPHAKHTVMDLVQGVEQRVYPVGRLDADSAGLLLLTNDGDFTERLTHPRHQVPKTYRAVVRGAVPEWAGADLRKGILLQDGMTAPADVEWIDYDEANNASIIDITIHEGRNRQVRRMFDAVGYPVLALTRMSIGPIQLKGIAPGTWRKLHPAEVKALMALVYASPQSLPQVPEPDRDLPAEPTADRPQRPIRAKPAARVERRETSPARSASAAKPKPVPAGKPDHEAQIRAAAQELKEKLRAAGKSDDDYEPDRRRNDKGRKPK